MGNLGKDAERKEREWAIERASKWEEDSEWVNDRRMWYSVVGLYQENHKDARGGKNIVDNSMNIVRTSTTL